MKGEARDLSMYNYLYYHSLHFNMNALRGLQSIIPIMIHLKPQTKINSHPITYWSFFTFLAFQIGVTNRLRKM